MNRHTVNRLTINDLSEMKSWRKGKDSGLVDNLIVAVEELVSQDCFGLFLGNQLIAIAEMRDNEDYENSLEICNVIVKEDLRGLGFGSRLMKFMISQAPFNWEAQDYYNLMLFPAHPGLHRFYERLGFKAEEDPISGETIMKMKDFSPRNYVISVIKADIEGKRIEDIAKKGYQINTLGIKNPKLAIANDFFKCVADIKDAFLSIDNSYDILLAYGKHSIDSAIIEGGTYAI